MNQLVPEPFAAELSDRLRQQELIAGLGLLALRSPPLDTLLDEACRAAARGLDSGFAKVLQFLPAEGAFLMRAGVGWRPGLVGTARLGADLESPAGYAFRTGQSVVSNHLSGEDRFRTPRVMAEHGIKRAINVLIGGGDTAPFGVLEVDSGDRQDFQARDVAFLQGLANTLAAAIHRTEQQAALVRSEALSRRLLDSSPDCLEVLDATGRLRHINTQGMALLGIGATAGMLGQTWTRFWSGPSRERAEAAVDAALGGTVGRFETREGGREGSARCWDVTVSPVVAEDGRVEHLVAVSHDITARQRDVAAKEAQLQQKDLLMQEVHHRVRNSLQLVQTLLQLQARNLRDPLAQRTLADAAQRVLTIAAVHKQLYVGRSVNEADLLPYLTGLLDDLHASLAGDGAGRSIELVAEPAVLSAEHLTSVGLVVAELVTNALKYGQGRVTVTLSVTAASARIVVEDQGDGFPAGFDPAAGQGLGMRLVVTLAQGAEAVRVDRGVPHGRIMVDLPLS